MGLSCFGDALHLIFADRVDPVLPGVDDVRIVVVDSEDAGSSLRTGFAPRWYVTRSDIDEKHSAPQNP